jgi:hypothetical protein
MIATDCIHEIRREWCGTCNPPRNPDSNRVIWADAAMMVIPGDGEEPLSLDEAAELAGLTRHQMDVAVAHMREAYPDLPLVSTRNGICFTMDEAQVAKFRAQGVRMALTIIRRRFRGAVVPYLRAAAASEQDMKRLTRQAERLLEDIEEFI